MVTERRHDTHQSETPQESIREEKSSIEQTRVHIERYQSAVGRIG